MEGGRNTESIWYLPAVSQSREISSHSYQVQRGCTSEFDGGISDPKSYHPGTSWNSNYPIFSQWKAVETLKISGTCYLYHIAGISVPLHPRYNLVVSQRSKVECQTQKSGQQGTSWNSNYRNNSQWDVEETLKSSGTGHLSDRATKSAPIYFPA